MKPIFRNTVLIFILLFCATNLLNAQTSYDYPTVTQNIPAFLGAEGFGKYATGGRGGYVVTVTNLDDLDADGNAVEGSLRWALAQHPNDPVTVVFNVSGWINIHKELRVSRKGGITIAGQTSPGEGITVYPRMFSVNGCTNVVVRNMRFRCGNKGYDGSDVIVGQDLVDQALCAENAQNIIFDHCSFGWAGEEIVNNADSHFHTFSYCILHEGLYDTGHHKGSRGFAAQWGGSQSTFHHNMIAHCNSRSPRFQGARNTDMMVYNEYINNVNFNWGGWGACYGGENSTPSPRYHTHQVNFCGNYYRQGPATKRGAGGKLYFYRQTGGTYVADWHFSGNYMDGSPEITANNSLGIYKEDASKYNEVAEFIEPTKFYPEYSFDLNCYTLRDKIQTAEVAYQQVLDKVGCIVRDSIERRLVRECREGTATFGGSKRNGGGQYGIIDHPDDAEMSIAENGSMYCHVAEPSISRPIGWDTDGDGMPDYWEDLYGFDKNNPEDGNLINAEGYTALEKYLGSLMGEELTGAFGDVTAIRTQYAVQFHYTFENGLLTIQGEDLTRFHLFDLQGICYMDRAIENTATIDLSALPANVYVMWVTNKGGYRNGVKLLKQ